MSIGKTISVQALWLGEAGPMNDQYRRPYETVATQETLNLIHDRVNQSRHARITPGMLSGATGSFIAPQATVEGTAVAIPYGWSMRRFYFFMVVAVRTNLTTYTELVQGYTDHADMSFTQKIDPNSRFFVNSITRMNTVREHTQYGMQETAHVSDSFHVMANNNWGGPPGVARGDIHYQSMRPSDIYMKLQVDQTMSGESFMDIRTSITAQPKPSSRMNGLASNYTGHILRSYADAISQDTGRSSSLELLAGAQQNTAELALRQHAFLEAMSRLTNLPISDSFSFSDLLRIDPTVDDRTTLVTTGAVQQHSSLGGYGPTAGFDVAGSNGWQGADYSTQAATIISNGITGLMIANGLSTVDFMATNHNMGGPVMVFTDARGLMNQDVSGVMSGFQTRVQDELVNQISQHNQISYKIRVRSSITYLTQITLQLDSHPEVNFVSPSFADALTTPVVTANPNRLQEVSHDFENLIGHVLEEAPTTLDQLNVGYNTI